MGGKGKGFSETTIKDTWTKLGRGEAGEGGGGGLDGGVVRGKCRRWYLNINKIIFKNKIALTIKTKKKSS